MVQADKVKTFKMPVPDTFDLIKTFESGQNFRYTIEKDWLTVVVEHRVLQAKQEKNNLTLKSIQSEDFSFWMHYLSLDEDYDVYLKNLCTDAPMAHALETGQGIRILKQSLWETTVCFILSQNNNIPRIKKLVEALCTTYGEPIDHESQVFYTLPTPEVLAEIPKEDLRLLGVGYRDRYLIDAAKRFAGGEIKEEHLKDASTADARKILMTIDGVGGKVADCILLFGLRRYEVCPHDVWVKRIFKEQYGLEKVSEKNGYALARERWGAYAGLAQQFLFYTARQPKK